MMPVYSPNKKTGWFMASKLLIVLEILRTASFPAPGGPSDGEG